MTEYTIYTDIQIAKSKKVHLCCKEGLTEHRWHPTVIGVLDELSDAGVKEALLVGENKCFRVLFDRAKAPKIVPLLTGREGYGNKDAQADLWGERK